jgi:hypothetical protein
MELIEVKNQEEANDFIRVNALLNRQYPEYIQPRNMDIEEVFDPEKNKAFRHGECARWLLKNEEGAYIGRIAAFVNKKYKNKGDDVPVGGIGFFDSIKNQEAADMLFDVAKHWLIQKGIQAMDGPINFGERDRWWGLGTDGLSTPMFGMNFNPPYYKDLYEQYGFLPFFKQVCFGMDFKKPMAKKVYDRHDLLAKDPAYKALHIRKNELKKFAGDFTAVYNQAYAGHGGLKELKLEQAFILFRQMKPFMDEKIVWFAYHHEKPIAIFINIPDLNQWFKYLHGKFGLLQKLRFLWIMKTKKNKKFTGIVFAVVPEFQAKGVDAFIIAESAKIIQSLEYEEYEMQWIGDFNPKMINVAEGLGHVYRSRMLTTYRYLFDRTKEFKRHPLLQ